MSKKLNYADLDVTHEIETQDAVINVEMDGWLTIYDLSHPTDGNGDFDYAQTIRKHTMSTMLHSSDCEKLAVIFAQLTPILVKAEEKSRAARIKFAKENPKPVKKKTGPKAKKKPGPKAKKKPGPKPKAKKGKK